jgi:prepilin-type N-terminal cleavage/methylation domain-containing protein
MTSSTFRGYTLVELIVSVGLFSIVMTLAAGAYFITINANRQAQGVATGVDSISFVVERMARTIRTGSSYSCASTLGAGDCPNGGSDFSFKNVSGQTVAYSLNGSMIQESINGGVARSLTDVSSVTITSMRFYLSGSSSADTVQPHVTLVIGGTASTGPGKTETFLIETGATMRGIDI